MSKRADSLVNNITTHLEEDVVKARAEVCPVYRIVAGRLWVVDILAFCAVELDIRAAWHIVLTHRQQVLTFADDSWALAKDTLLVLLHLQPCVSFHYLISVSLNETLTIFANPLVVTTYRACTKP